MSIESGMGCRRRCLSMTVGRGRHFRVVVGDVSGMVLRAVDDVAGRVGLRGVQHWPRLRRYTRTHQTGILILL